MSIRSEVLGLVSAKPGTTCAQLRAAMLATGAIVTKNEPSATLHLLRKQGLLRIEGEWPERTYFVIEGAAAIPLERAPRKSPTKPTKAKTESELSPFAARSIPPVRATPDVSEADAARLRLADAIVQHLELGAAYVPSEDIARDMAESRHDVAMAISLLMRDRRITRHADATGRWVYRDKRPGDEPPAPSPLPVSPVVPVEPANPVRLPEPVEAQTVEARPRLTAEEFNAIEKFMAITDQALDLPSLPGSIRLEMTAIEDILGEACDAEAPHAAIKSLVVAQVALRRALDVLTPRALAA